MKASTQTAGNKDIGPLAKVLYILATFQIVLVYIRNVPSYLRLAQYENGAGHMPFQGRVMMMFLLRWSHGSPMWTALANWCNRFAPWLLPHCTPEAALQVCIDVICIVATGWIAIRLYEASSQERLLIQWIYPLVLVMCATTFVLHTTQNLRFYYDLPSMMFVSVGVYLIYFRWHPGLFAVLFIIGTINRETTLFLLLFSVLRDVSLDRPIDFRRLRNPGMWMLVLPLASAWMVWRLWIEWIFRHNVSESAPKFFLNLALVCIPWTWPQMLGACCYLFPVLLLCRRSIKDPTIRNWIWVLPAWVAVMFFYGILVETRIFGELIGYVTCATALIAEQGILSALERRGWSHYQGFQQAFDGYSFRTVWTKTAVEIKRAQTL